LVPSRQSNSSTVKCGDSAYVWPWPPFPGSRVRAGQQAELVGELDRVVGDELVGDALHPALVAVVVVAAQAHAVARVPQPVREAAVFEVALGEDVVAFDAADLGLAAGALLGVSGYALHITQPPRITHICQ
jgi:hypothetical protein